MPARKTFKSYRVRWEIDVDARNVTEAAKRALEIQRDPESTALFFEVTDSAFVYHGVPVDWVGVDLEAKGSWCKYCHHKTKSLEAMNLHLLLAHEGRGAK